MEGTQIHNYFESNTLYIEIGKAERKRLVCILFLKVSRVLQFLTVTGRLFHKAVAAFLKHLLPYVTPRVIGMAKNAPLRA